MKQTITTFILGLITFMVVAQEKMPAVTTSTAGQLTVTFAIPNPGTQTHYAVYITNASNALVNTLSYAYSTIGEYQYQLSTLYSLVGNTIDPTTLKYVNSPDGYTGATISASQASKTVYWGKTGTMASNVAALPDGNYTINFEIVKRNNNRTKTSATFRKGPTTVTPTVSPTISTFTGISIQWTPATTGINNIEHSTLYSIYPNPAISNIYINGPGLQRVEIFNLDGKRMLTTNQSGINISSLKKGDYIVNIKTDKGTIAQKLIKK